MDKSHQGGYKTGREEEWRDRGKIEWKLPEINTRGLPRGQKELIMEFKMAAGDLISVTG